jgi:hypothetical protein
MSMKKGLSEKSKNRSSSEVEMTVTYKSAGTSTPQSFGLLCEQ